MAWTLFEQVRTIGFLEMGFDGRISRCNRGLAKLLGVDASEIVGKQKVGFIAPEDRPNAYKRLLGYVNGSLSQCETETRLIKPNGARLWVSLESIVVLNERNERVSVLCMVFEIPNGEQASKIMELERKLASISELVIQMAAVKAGHGQGVTLNIGQTNVDDVNGGRNVIGENNEQRRE